VYNIVWIINFKTHTKGEMMETQVCFKCNEERPIERFGKWSHTGGKYSGVSGFCKDCYNKERREREIKKFGSEQAMIDHKNLQARKHYVKRLYGLEWEDYISLLEEQDYKCQICSCEMEAVGKFATVDHCHSTGMVRGILCRKCNSGLGLFNDDLESLKRAIQYLENAYTGYQVPEH
jgi:hypothetical protein